MAIFSNNVDPAEIAKFSLLAEDWWNPFGSSKPLHDINPLRFEFIKKYTPLSNMAILDIGCGGGILSESLAKEGGKVTGIDLSEDAIKVATLHSQDQNVSVTYQVASAEDYAEEFPAQFDIITCMELLEHVPSPDSIIQACATLLKPKGHLFLSTINRNPKAYLYAILGAEYLLKLLPKGTHQYEKFIRPIEMAEMLHQADLQLAHMSGMHYHPIFKTYSLTDDVSVNYLVHCYKG
ncbi:MAG: bifunctional 2-polyprenyl-6-hydroxyphenol methylase/3-demethylubiquinol 3-O-methyltransferase UbiG [Gammaproteobacteria bacterium]|nr:bifunctional 2-polyprenyl-6-hydroxyphenol methylase/3-demethylubiquinol 3-O-methyltransferase UbiG [Gammaproteobacteria bacterium]